MVLPANQTFTVAGATTNEPCAFGGDQTTGLAFDPALAPTSPGAFFEPGPTLTFPTQPSPNNYNLYAGPNLLLVPVPEPV
jgi:hypothetical protein